MFSNDNHLFPRFSENRGRYTLVLLLLLVYCVVLIRTAWISDDAAITLRTVLNFVYGYGPRFNIDERVQAYTHPLWFFLLSLFTLVFRDVFSATFIMSIGVSLLTFWMLLMKFRASSTTIMLVATMLILSRAFIDYSTSGLENPLSHLLILACCISFFRLSQKIDSHDIFFFFLSCSLIYLNRPDLLLLVAPIAILVFFKGLSLGIKFWLALALGGLPVVIWTIFSIYYYGFPFPNTAYAKLGTGIALNERIVQGLLYLQQSIHKDPLTILVIACGMLIGFYQSLDKKLMALGILLYLCYVISIGGDFMEGRFLTAPLFAAVLIILQCNFTRLQSIITAIVIAALGLLWVDHPTLRSSTSYVNGVIYPSGIADERGHYYQKYALLKIKGYFFEEARVGIKKYEEYDSSVKSITDVRIICGGLGFNSIIAGPTTHFIDDCALADPLLSRIPARFKEDWRIGHFYRQLPTNYLVGIRENQNLLSEPSVHDFYESIRIITRYPLNDIVRLKEIWKFNTLKKEQKPDFHDYIHGSIAHSSVVPKVRLRDLGKIVENGTAYDAHGNVFSDYAIDIDLEISQSFQTIDISLDNNDFYTILIDVDGTLQPVAKINPIYTSGMIRHRLTLEKPTPVTNRIQIRGEPGDGLYAVGHLILGTEDKP